MLGSWKIATERSELILPCLQDTVERFGAPCAAMRDMGRAVTPAIEALVCQLDTDIPVFVCHQHFLSDIGKDLLEPCHSELRGFFRRTKTRPKLRSLVRDLGRKIGEQINESRKAVQQWQTGGDDSAVHYAPQKPASRCLADGLYDARRARVCLARICALGNQVSLCRADSFRGNDV